MKKLENINELYKGCYLKIEDRDGINCCKRSKVKELKYRYFKSKSDVDIVIDGIQFSFNGYKTGNSWVKNCWIYPSNEQLMKDCTLLYRALSDVVSKLPCDSKYSTDCTACNAESVLTKLSIYQEEE